MKFIGLDIGSSFIKGAILDARTLTIGQITRVPFPEPIAGLPPGQFEIDPGGVVAAVRKTLDGLLANLPHCEGILFSSQMGGVILADRHGKPLSNYISWRDQRAAQPHPTERGTLLEVARERLGRQNALSSLGNEFRTGSALAILFWLAEQGQLPPGAVALPLGSYILQQLGGEPACTDRTLALAMLNLETSDWHWGALKCLGLTGLAWPRLVPAWQPAGTFNRPEQGIPCYPPIGDHQAALAGALLASGELSLNISTGSQISLLTDKLALGNYQTRPYLDGRFLNTITHLPAGRSLDVLVNLITEAAQLQRVKLESPWATIVRAAEGAEDGGLAIDLAFFDGPLGNRGSISGITTENLTIGQLFRAAFRNMAGNYATCAARLSPNQDWQRIVFSGGLAQNLPLLRQFILEKLPGESRLCPSSEDALLGLLVICLVISGRAKNLDEASRLLS